MSKKRAEAPAHYPAVDESLSPRYSVTLFDWWSSARYGYLTFQPDDRLTIRPVEYALRDPRLASVYQDALDAYSDMADRGVPAEDAWRDMRTKFRHIGEASRAL
jgi:hypothetical protein